MEVSEADGQEFLQVPLVATLFGRKKLLASPYRAAVEVDTKLLHEFGATQAASIKRGIELHVRRFTAYVAREIEKRPEDRGEYIGMLELLARRHAVTWLDIAKLWSEMDDGGELDHAKAAVRQYLEQSGDAAGPEPWRMLADYCRSSGDIIGEIDALVELCKKADVEFHVISAWASRFNGVVAAARDVLEKDEKMMLADEIASVMEGRIDEGNATDRSRVAWLCLQLGDVERAWSHTQEGLGLDPRIHIASNCGSDWGNLGTLRATVVGMRARSARSVHSKRHRSRAICMRSQNSGPSPQSLPTPERHLGGDRLLAPQGGGAGSSG